MSLPIDDGGQSRILDPQMNLVKLALDDAHAFAALLKPFVDVVVRDPASEYVISRVTARINSDIHQLPAGALGRVPRDIRVLDALLYYKDVNVEALTIALKLGADPDEGQSEGFPGLVYQGSKGNWDVVDYVVSAGMTHIPADYIYAEFTSSTNKALTLENAMRTQIYTHGRRQLACLLMHGDLYAIYNRMRRNALTYPKDLHEDFKGRSFFDCLAIAPEDPDLLDELSYRYKTDMRLYTLRPEMIPPETRTSASPGDLMKESEALVRANIIVWTRASTEELRVKLEEVNEQAQFVEDLKEELVALRDTVRSQQGRQPASSANYDGPGPSSA